MSGTLVLRDIGKLLVPEIFLIAAELVYRKLGAVAFDVAVQGGFEAGSVEGIAGGEALGHSVEMGLAGIGQVVPSSNTISLTK